MHFYHNTLSQRLQQLSAVEYNHRETQLKIITDTPQNHQTHIQIHINNQTEIEKRKRRRRRKKEEDAEEEEEKPKPEKKFHRPKSHP